MRSFWRIAVLLPAIFCSPGLSATANKEKTSDKLVVVSVAQKTVTINKQDVDFRHIDKESLDEILKAESSRRRTSTCFLYLWDDAGLRVYGAWGFQKGIDYCDFIFQKSNRKDEIQPRSTFSGKLTISGLDVTAKTTVEDLQKSWGEKLKSRPEQIYKLALKKYEISFYFGTGKENALQSVQISRRSKT